MAKRFIQPTLRSNKIDNRGNTTRTSHTRSQSPMYAMNEEMVAVRAQLGEHCSEIAALKKTVDTLVTQRVVDVASDAVVGQEEEEDVEEEDDDKSMVSSSEGESDEEDTSDEEEDGAARDRPSVRA